MRLYWARPARADLDRIWFFNADRNVEFADRVEARLQERAAALGRFPKLGRSTGSGGRRVLSIVDIQYTLEYRIDDDAAWILHVRSTREDRAKS